MQRNRIVDLEREGKGGAAILSRYQWLSVSARGIQERLDLESQGFTGLDWDFEQRHSRSWLSAQGRGIGQSRRSTGQRGQLREV